MGCEHVTTGFTVCGPALLRHKTRTVMKNSWRARALYSQFVQGHRRHIELGDNASGLGTTLAVVLLAIKVKETKIHSFGVQKSDRLSMLLRRCDSKFLGNFKSGIKVHMVLHTSNQGGQTSSISYSITYQCALEGTW